MPFAARPDGVEIHWEAHGEGPLVLLAHHLWSYPEIYNELVSNLARDHRIVVFDPRGCGQSSARGPYEADTDAADLLAVAAAAGGNGVALAVGSGFNVAARAATARPDLVARVLAVGPAAAAFLPRAELKDSGVLAASESVVDMLLTMLSTEPRAALRTIVAANNPELDEHELRERVERGAAYLAPGAPHDRARAWLEDDVSEEARALGDRLWILAGGPEAFYEGALAARVPELYPDAHLEDIGGGPVSRPDLTAAIVRRVTSG